MSAIDFANTIIGELNSAIGTDGSGYNSSSATSAMAAVASGITKYLIANTKVTIAYAGTLTSVPPAPDPVVTDTFQIVGSCAPPGPASGFDAWILQIQANIIAGFQLAPVGQGGVVFPQVPFLMPGITTSQTTLKANHDVSDTDPQLKIWKVICQGIMDWINSGALNPTPGPASRAAGPSTGMANITSIQIT